MTFSGILCIFGCAHAQPGEVFIARELLKDCTEPSKSGNVHLMRVKKIYTSGSNVIFEIIVSSGPVPQNKIEAMKLKGDRAYSRTFTEKERYPVLDCLRAKREVSQKLMDDYSSVALDKGERLAFGIKADQEKGFLFAIETALEFLVYASIPPDHLLKPCTQEPGYLHLYFLPFFYYGQNPGQYQVYCIRIFASSQPLFNPENMFASMSLPLVKLFGVSRVKLYHVKNCESALAKLLEEVSKPSLVNRWENFYVCGQWFSQVKNIDEDWDILTDAFRHATAGLIVHPTEAHIEK